VALPQPLGPTPPPTPRPYSSPYPSALLLPLPPNPCPPCGFLLPPELMDMRFRGQVSSLLHSVVSLTPVTNLELLISPGIYEKIRKGLMVYLEAWGKLIQEKKTE
jgi:hypothetical protein